MLSDEAFVDDSANDAVPNNVRQLPEFCEASLSASKSLRNPLSQLNERAELPPKVLKRGPGALVHISHSWGGGLGRWISDFCAAEEDFLHLVLKSVGTRKAGAQALTLHLGAEPLPLKQCDLTTPILSTSLGSHEYRQIC